ncbi:glycoside hydrolase family 3 N-terminal domain-containing protein [Arthrobacter sp. H5]|uniref:glycoside hydrolase family 3 protein n=1 Tax=Arthrobacter sp. H5 TaxID=1267973 RepID=UPI0020A6474F|nr:glycoside hydrolase family 3 N-terminal domain-containing protein [Arthrobacter sp. H5]
MIRLVNSVIWPGFNGTSLPPWLEAALQENLAGVVYFSQNIDDDDPGQIRRLSANIRALNPHALIGSDEEGGNVTRLQSVRGSDFPGAAALGVVDDTGSTAEVGRALAHLARAAGINVVISPVADVNTNPDNPVIGVRSFGSDTALVSRHVAAMVRGIQSQRVAACVKHFPGHGDTSSDSHVSLPRVELSLAEMERDHLPPFRAAVEAGVMAVMSAHIVVPDLGEEPATLNRTALNLLRNSGFGSLIITDALDMAAVRSTVGSGPGAVMALQAGADLLCVGNPSNLGPKGGTSVDEDDYLEVRNALLNALASGALNTARLEESAARIKQCAAWTRTDAEPFEGGTDWTRLAGKAINTEPLDNAVNLRQVHVLDARAQRNMAAGPQTDVFAAAFAAHIDVHQLHVGSPESVATAVAELTITADTAVLVLTDNLSTGGTQLTAARETLRLVPDAVVVNAGVAPADSGLRVIHTHGASRATAAALADRLLGRR